MQPQFITTDGGEELVLLSRRDYDAMLARLGDEDAEDRMTERLVAEARERIASGEENLVKAGADGRPPRLVPGNFDGIILRDVRKAAGISQMQLADAAGITQGYLSDIEGDRKKPTEDVLNRLIAALDSLGAEK